MGGDTLQGDGGTWSSKAYLGVESLGVLATPFSSPRSTFLLILFHCTPAPNLQITDGRFPLQEGSSPRTPTHLSNPPGLLKVFVFFSPPIFFFSILQHLINEAPTRKGF